MDLIRIISVIGSELIPLGAVPPSAIEGVLRAITHRDTKPDGEPYTDAEVLAKIEAARAPWQRIKDRAAAETPPEPPLE